VAHASDDVEAVIVLDLDRASGDGQLTDLFLGQVVEPVRPHRVDGHGKAWRELVSHPDEISASVESRSTSCWATCLIAWRPTPTTGSEAVSS
jgi:hypothetical protein